MIGLIEKIAKYMNASPENRTQVIILLGFFIVPVIGLGLLYLIMMIFVIK